MLSLLLSLIRAGNKPPPATPGKPKKATTFQEFESITSDAWDVGDDDDELLAMAAQNLNIEVVMETANKVRARCEGVVVKKLSDGALNTYFPSLWSVLENILPFNEVSYYSARTFFLCLL